MRRNAWTVSETHALIKYYDNSIQLLMELFPRHSQDSINRKIGKLRKEGRIGLKSEKAIKESHRLSHTDSRGRSRTPRKPTNAVIFDENYRFND